MQKNLLIVFAKNKLFGKVKTRLAKTIGEESAYEVYEALYHITEQESCAVSTADVEVHYSHFIDAETWVDCRKFVQVGESLGERMKHAFTEGFKQGYQTIIGIGADLPEIQHELIEEAFRKLESSDFTFGPAEDGGYYLVGMSNASGRYIFDDKPWSTKELLKITKAEIVSKKQSITFLETLNDIDTVEDLEKSAIGTQFETLISKSKES